MSTVHLSDLMFLWLLTALFKYSASSKLPGWVICPHGFPFSFCYHHRMWRLHSHEPEDVQFPQYRWRRWFSCYSQLADVSTGSFRAAPNSSASQTSPEERWELTQKWIGSFLQHLLQLIRSAVEGEFFHNVHMRVREYTFTTAAILAGNSTGVPTVPCSF